jgi:hypothetical protein
VFHHNGSHQHRAPPGIDDHPSGSPSAHGAELTGAMHHPIFRVGDAKDHRSRIYIIYHNIYIIWLVVEPTPLKNDGLKVSWDDDYSQYMEK